MARQRKSKVKTVISVLIVLIGLQLVFMFYFGGSPGPVSTKEIVEKSVDELEGVNNERREIAKLQAAVVDFFSKNKRYPTSLVELVPTYFEQVPVNPSTKEPYPYRLEGTTFYIGNAQPAGKDGKAGDTLQDQGISEGEKDALLASLRDDLAGTGTADNFVYDSSGKRDPFVPSGFNTAPKVVGNTPLESIPLSEMKLAAVLMSDSEPRAIVESSRGQGFTVKKGTKIGIANGEVVEIQKDRLLILETQTELDGTQKSRTVELTLRGK